MESTGIKKLEKPGYMMATKAFTTVGEDISRDTPDLCFVRAEADGCYIGNWVAHMNHVDVRFPKTTTRELTEEEKDRCDGTVIGFLGAPMDMVRTRKNIVPSGVLTVKTGNSIYRFGAADEKGERIVTSDNLGFGFTRCIIDYLSIGKSMRIYQPDNPENNWTTTPVLSIE